MENENQTGAYRLKRNKEKGIIMELKWEMKLNKWKMRQSKYRIIKTIKMTKFELQFWNSDIFIEILISFILLGFILTEYTGQIYKHVLLIF